MITYYCFMQEVFTQNITTKEEEFNATKNSSAKNVLFTFRIKATNVRLSLKLYAEFMKISI